MGHDRLDSILGSYSIDFPPFPVLKYGLWYITALGMDSVLSRPGIIYYYLLRNISFFSAN
jgi:hypothetical protein